MAGRLRTNRYGESYRIKWVFWPKRVRKTKTGEMRWKMFRRVRKYKRTPFGA